MLTSRSIYIPAKVVCFLEAPKIFKQPFKFRSSIVIKPLELLLFDMWVFSCPQVVPLGIIEIRSGINLQKVIFVRNQLLQCSVDPVSTFCLNYMVLFTLKEL